MGRPLVRGCPIPLPGAHSGARYHVSGGSARGRRWFSSLFWPTLRSPPFLAVRWGPGLGLCILPVPQQILGQVGVILSCKHLLPRPRPQICVLLVPEFPWGMDRTCPPLPLCAHCFPVTRAGGEESEPEDPGAVAERQEPWPCPPSPVSPRRHRTRVLQPPGRRLPEGPRPQRHILTQGAAWGRLVDPLPSSVSP